MTPYEHADIWGATDDKAKAARFQRNKIQRAIAFGAPDHVIRKLEVELTRRVRDWLASYTY